ncbi:DUF1934 domain-containing protein [Numidum massiliense]|uniref:DUF1934 domain-containing protein n=1 Tax=Numidum massiliense TaxID=1522315 RepID=UPI0006D537D0|nr:DUF1934 domain-containing protein [Numidum massiliense]
MTKKGIPVAVVMTVAQQLPGEQAFQREGQEQQAVQEHRYTGTAWIGSKQWVVRYVEQAQADDRERERSEVHTTVKVKADELLVIRRGAVAMRQLFRPGVETSGSYVTPYGAMHMVTATEHLAQKTTAPEESDSTAKGNWYVAWRYRLTLNGADAGTFAMTLTVQPQQ